MEYLDARLDGLDEALSTYGTSFSTRDEYLRLSGEWEALTKLKYLIVEGKICQ